MPKKCKKKTTKKKEVNHANIIIDHFPFFYHKTEERKIPSIIKEDQIKFQD